MLKNLGKLVLLALLATGGCCVGGCDLVEDSSMEHTFDKK